MTPAPAGLGSLRVAHVGLVVRDIEARAWMHHLAFIAGAEAARYEAQLAELGCPGFQEGEWAADPAPSAGRYLYLDSSATLGATLELLSLGAPGRS